MTRPELLKLLDSTLDTAERTHEWGSIEIELRDGIPVVLRRSTTKKLIPDDTGRKYRAPQADKTETYNR
jgi:hypothetical protein